MYIGSVVIGTPFLERKSEKKRGVEDCADPLFLIQLVAYESSIENLIFNFLLNLCIRRKLS